MNRNKILELAKKIKALAEKGKDGEKNVAKEIKKCIMIIKDTLCKV